MSSHTRRITTRYTSSVPIDRNGRSYAYGFDYTPSSCVERDSRRRGGISTVSHNTVMYAALEHAAAVYGSINVVVV